LDAFLLCVAHECDALGSLVPHAEVVTSSSDQPQNLSWNGRRGMRLAINLLAGTCVISNSKSRRNADE
jgi:hypothetical protein